MFDFSFGFGSLFIIGYILWMLVFGKKKKKPKYRQNDIPNEDIIKDGTPPKKPTRIERVPPVHLGSMRGEMMLYFSTGNFILTGDLICENDFEIVTIKNSLLRVEDGKLYIGAVSTYEGMQDGSTIEMSLNIPPIRVTDVLRVSVDNSLVNSRHVDLDLLYKEKGEYKILHFEFWNANARKMAAQANEQILELCCRQ